MTKSEQNSCMDAVYEERNRVVALLAAVFPSVRARTAIEGWSEDWHGCIYITLPTGQASWHYHDSQAHLFAHVPEGAAIWDGHTTPQKYERVAAACHAALTAKAQRNALQARVVTLEAALRPIACDCEDFWDDCYNDVDRPGDCPGLKARAALEQSAAQAQAAQ